MTSTDNSDDDGVIQSYQNDALTKVELIIYHQFPGVELISPVYVGSGVKYYLPPDQRVMAGSTARIGFNIYSIWIMSMGVMIYKLQRKNTDEFNEVTISNEEEETCIQLVMIWKVNISKEFCVALFLIEHDKDYDWDKLLKLARHYQLTNIQRGPIEYTWLMHDNTVLMTSLNITREEEHYKLEMTLSEESINRDTWRPWCLYLNSFERQPTIEVDIYNQCSGIELIKQGYFSSGADWNEEPYDKVDAESIMSVGLKSPLAIFEGALIYELRRKYAKIDNQLDSAYTLLLATWKSEGYKNFYVFLQLIECDRTSYWNNAKLERYYQRYHNQLSTYTGSIKDTWLIDDDVVLMTRLELDFTQRDGVLSIIISEGVKDEHAKRPERINLESFDKEALNITIHNLYPDLELTSPIYCGNGAICYVSPSQQTDTDNIMEASFGIAFKQEEFKGVLLYKLQRKHTIKTDNHLNSSIVYIEGAATNVHLLVVWDFGHYFYDFCVCLIEYINDFTWDEDKLWTLYRDYNNEFCVGYESKVVTWLTNNGAVIKARYDITYRSDYKLDIVLSEGTVDYKTKKPIRINPKRIYIKPSIKLNIHNQCLDVDLVSPTYIIHGWLDCHKPFDYKVCAGDTMRSGFTIYNPENEPNGILIYGLQRKRPHESTEISKSTSNVAHLLVIWGISKSKKLYSDVLLVKHDRISIWNKDNLEELYCKNVNQFRQYSSTIKETWSLDDNVALMTAFEMMNGGRILDITISEVERNNYVRTPAYIDPESLMLQLSSCINVLNLCSNAKLASPIFFGDGVVCPKLSDSRIDIGTKTSTSFEINATEDEFEGALLFKLQRYADSKRDMNASTTETDKNNATCVHMLAIWKVNDSKLFVRTVLVEHTKGFAWNGDKLKELYHKNRSWLKEYDDTISDTWLVDTNMILKTSFRAGNLKRTIELSISISEREKDDYAMRPLCVNLKSLQSPVSLNIHNLCKAINLTSPAYFMHGGRWYTVPDPEVNFNAAMKNYLGFDSGQDILEGALIYRIQRIQHVESDKSVHDKSKDIQLVVAWHVEHKKELHVRVLLVEHDREFDWDEDKLRRLHQKYWHSLNTQTDPIKSNWLLDNMMVLTTTIKVMNEGYRWDISIYEGSKSNVERPLWIDIESLTFYKTMVIAVHNRYPDIELTSPMYFCSRGTYNEHPVEEMNASAMMRIGFRFDINQDEPGGILMYKIRRKSNARSSHQSGIDTVYSKVIKEASEMMHLLVIWKIERSRKPKVNIMLVEYDNELVLNEDRLVQLYKIDVIPLKDNYFCENTWLICDNTALEVAYAVVRKEDLELKIYIYRGIKDKYIKSALWLDSESLTLQSAMNVTIDNRCSKMELASPMYFTKDATCHIQFPQQVNTGHIIRVNFKTRVDRDIFGGVLLYHLQRKKDDESDNPPNIDKDTSISTQLLVIWGSKSDCLYSHAYIIEHESTLTWSEDKLERLYDGYNSQYGVCPELGRWTLKDGILLVTKCESSHGGLEMEIIFSEDHYLFLLTKPLCIDSNSFIFRQVSPVIIHNRCSDFELVSPANFVHNTIWYIPPDQKVDANTMIKAIFGRNMFEIEFKIALIYNLQMKKRLESNDQSNADNAFTENTSTSIQLLVMWGPSVKYKNGFSVRALLIKHDDAIIWDEDKLKDLHSMHLAQLNKGIHVDVSNEFKDINFFTSNGNPFAIEDTWMLDDATVLMTTLKWNGGSYTFEITISEGTRKHDSMEPLPIPSSI